MEDRNTKLEVPAPTEEEDEATLGAIDKGDEDADAGRVTAIEQVEEMLPQWLSKSSSLTKH
jgi:predicted transcriptional regulator